MAGIFPEGFTSALQNLLEVLSKSPNSYSVKLFRYEGDDSYRAVVEATYIAPPAPETVEMVCLSSDHRSYVAATRSE